MLRYKGQSSIMDTHDLEADANILNILASGILHSSKIQQLWFYARHWEYNWA